MLKLRISLKPHRFQKPVRYLPTVFNRKDRNLQNYLHQIISIDTLFLDKEEIQLLETAAPILL